VLQVGKLDDCIRSLHANKPDAPTSEAVQYGKLKLRFQEIKYQHLHHVESKRSCCCVAHKHGVSGAMHLMCMSKCLQEGWATWPGRVKTNTESTFESKRTDRQRKPETLSRGGS
jgi:hypothetical protein